MHVLYYEGAFNVIAALLSAVSPFLDEPGKWCVVAAAACNCFVIFRLIHHARAEPERQRVERITMLERAREALPHAAEEELALENEVIQSEIAQIGAAPPP